MIGTLAVVLASFSYAAGGLYGQRAVGHQPARCWRVVDALRRRSSCFRWRSSSCPDHAPDWKPVASLVALSVGGTAIAQLVLFRMLRLFGAARVSLVTYLMPVTRWSTGRRSSTSRCGRPCSAGWA